MPTMPRSNSLQNRLACDRCHSQKLRCQRQHGQGSCQRCSHLNATCVFSPRQPRRALPTISDSVRARTSTPVGPGLASSVQPAVGNHNLNVLMEVDAHPHPDAGGTTGVGTDLDIPMWLQAGSSTSPGANRVSDLTSMLGINLHSDFAHDCATFNFAPDLITGLNFDLEPNVMATSSTQVGPTRDDSIVTLATDAEYPMSGRGMEMVQYVRQLADLNVRLCEHMNMLPPLPSGDPASASDAGRVPSMNGQLFPIDKTFSLTQFLIDQLKQLYPPSGLSLGFVPDQGTLLLIMSCSGRVFDIYEVIFGHMRGCVNNNITPVTANGQTIVLPQLKIGAYSPPKPTAIAMQMLLIVMLASELFDQLQEVLGVWQRSKRPVKGGGHAHFEDHELTVGTGPQYPNFTEETRLEMERRAQSVAVEIVGMRRMLMNLPGMTGTGSL